jgi:hypothetical protein
MTGRIASRIVFAIFSKKSRESIFPFGIGAGRNGARRRLSDRVVVTTTERLDDFDAAGFFAAAFAAGFFAAAFFAVFFAVAFAFAFGLVFNFAFPPALEAVFDLALEVARDFDPAFARDVLLFFAATFFFAFAAMVTRLRSRFARFSHSG